MTRVDRPCHQTPEPHARKQNKMQLLGPGAEIPTSPIFPASPLLRQGSVNSLFPETQARTQNKMQLLGPGAAFPTSPLLRGSSTGSARSLLVNPLSSSYTIHAVVFFFVYHRCNPILRRISYMLSFSSLYIIYRRSCAARRTAADAHSWSTPSLHRISCMLTYM